MNTLIILLLSVSIIFILVDIIRTFTKRLDQTPKVIYRYIPRTFEEELQDPVYVSELYGGLFEQPSPWVSSLREVDTKKQEQINNYFINAT